MLTNNEIKDIMKAIRFSEDILLKKTTGRVIYQEEGLFNFFDHW